jgi:hypothetical protein
MVAIDAVGDAIDGALRSFSSGDRFSSRKSDFGAQRAIPRPEKTSWYDEENFESVS